MIDYIYCIHQTVNILDVLTDSVTSAGPGTRISSPSDRHLRPKDETTSQKRPVGDARQSCGPNMLMKQLKGAEATH